MAIQFKELRKYLARNIRKQGRMSPGFWEPEALLGMAASQIRRNLEAVQH